ncbi:MAG: alpha-ketoacid dehydrogenase subunit beta [Armatimonadetes bacterium]|nr:alpha-ketoacid dehydrogenase subunit beta [Armatimonadota bacterium]
MAEKLRNITFAQAIRTALRAEMKRDERVILFGEDVGYYGGVYGATVGLQKEFGEDRVRDTPISEMAIGGVAVGAALAGYRPVAEIMYCDFLAHASDAIVNNAAKWRYMSGGQFALPIVFRSPGGGGAGYAAQHSQSLEAWFAHIPGLKVVAPSLPRDARGLLKAAIRDDNPVVFLEHKAHYTFKGEVPVEEEVIPLGVAEVKRAGNDVTVVSWSKTLTFALEAAETLAAEGIDTEVIDPRTLQPLDIEAILASIGKTRHLVVAHEAVQFGGLGGEIVAQVAERALDSLKRPPVRVAAPFVPIPYSEPMELRVIPQVADIVAGVRRSLG